jgi:hypothetical protein
VWIRSKEQVLLNRHSGKQMTLGRYEPHPKPSDSLGGHPGDVAALEDNLP